MKLKLNSTELNTIQYCLSLSYDNFSEEECREDKTMRLLKDTILSLQKRTDEVSEQKYL